MEPIACPDLDQDQAINGYSHSNEVRFRAWRSNPFRRPAAASNILQSSFGGHSPARLICLKDNSHDPRMLHHQGGSMPRFAFEVARREGTLVLAYELSVSDYRSAWCQAEALACEHKDSLDSYIQVKDENGGVIIRTGIGAALQSIQRCRRATCSLKRLNA